MTPSPEPTLVSSLLVILLASTPLTAPANPPAEALTLERALELALSRNERPAAARARSEAAQARLARARSAFLPSLNVSGTYTRRLYQTTRELEGQTVVTQRRDALGAVAVARMSLFDATLFPLHAQAAHNRDAARLDAVEEARRLGYDVAEAFIAVLSSEQVRAAAGRRLEFARTALNDAEVRFGARLVSSNDVTKAKLEVASAERELARAGGEVESSYLTLALLIGQESLAAPLAPPGALLTEASSVTPELPGGLAEDALLRRLDLAASRERWEGLKAYALEPRMRLIPQLDATAQYQLTNDAGLAGRNDNGFAQLALSWDLFDGGARYADRRERSALAEAAELELRALSRRIPVEVRNAHVALRSAEAARRQAQLAAEAAEQNAQEIAILYRQGLTSALEAANAGVQLFDAQVALAREQYALVLALLNLRAAQGLDALGKDVKP